MAAQMETTAAQTGPWWAAGDLPVRAGCKLTTYIDGHSAMLAMCRAFLSARESILLAGWDLRADFPMVRGEDVALIAAAAPDRDRRLAALRAQGLDDAAIALWSQGRLRVVDVLGLAVQRGVRVSVLLWDAFHLGSHLTNDPSRQRHMLGEVGVECLLDDSSRSVSHITQSLHQKCSVVDGRVAFVGGIDLTVADEGDYDRWDTHRHPCSSPDRVTLRRPSAHPWHDVHCRVEGPAVHDVERNIVERWNAVAERHHVPLWPLPAEADAAPAPGDATVQIVRTIPPRTYAFAPDGIATIKQAYVRALGQARTYVYMENQYLWPEVFLGLDTLAWGGPSEDVREVLEAMAAALQRGVHLALVLPDHPNCGRRFSDAGVEWLRERATSHGAAERLHVFTLGASEDDASAPGGTFYRPVYTHAKVAIVDDAWFTVGSANLNSRGMRSDAEINVSALDPATAQRLRATLWAEHLGRPTHLHHALEEPVAGLKALASLADANRRRIHLRQPLVGHILPYVTAADAARLDLPVHPEHGWLDNLPGGSGAHAAHHAGRYL